MEKKAVDVRTPGICSILSVLDVPDESVPGSRFVSTDSNSPSFISPSTSSMTFARGKVFLCS